jgi:hypothetical protein
MATKKIALNELRSLVKKIINEENYSDYLDTHYSSDGMDDYHSEKALYSRIEQLYDAGKIVYDLGEKDLGNRIRERVLQIARSTDWGEEELPKY